MSFSKLQQGNRKTEKYLQQVSATVKHVVGVNEAAET
jgi:hypothetical protein